MHLSTYVVPVANVVPAVPVAGNKKFFLNMHTLMCSLSLIFCKSFTDIILLIMG